MNYQFPIINNISDVLPAIEGRDEFVVAKKDGGYTVINYMVAFDDTFPEVNTVNDAIRRECRGIIFDTETGNILHRRFNKFFNVGERPETQFDQIDLSKPHNILDKIDGSMITPVITTDGIRFGTKMGVTDVALPVEEYVVDHPEIISLCNECIDQNLTPIFEWTSRKQQIVIDYVNDNLTLLAVRHNVTGEYKSYEWMKSIAEKHNVPLVQQYSGNVDDIQSLVAHIREMSGVEGFVIRFDDGHMVKIKCDEYVSLHRAKDGIRFEKNVVDIIVNEKLDDLKSFLQGNDLERINNFEHKFWEGVTNTSHQLKIMFEAGVAQYPDRKDFAVQFVNRVEPHYRPFLFQLYADKDAVKCILDVLKKKTGSQTDIDKSRWLFGDVKWDECEAE